MQLQKNVKVFFSLLLILAFIVGIFVGLASSNIFKPDYEKLDDCFKVLHKTVIYNVGKSNIDEIVDNTSYLGKNPKRLTQIADLITRDFSNPNWDYQQNDTLFCYYPDDRVKYNYCLLTGQGTLTTLTGQPLKESSYMVDKKGRMRQYYVNSGMIGLNTDPYWIAYQKTGECQELSVLFNETANKSGFVTRIVRSNGNGHFWNEVNIDGEWKFFDVQKYGMKNTNDSSKWFGNTSEYANAYSWTLCDMINEDSKKSKPGIFVYDINHDGYGENRNIAYDPDKKCIKLNAAP